VLVSRSLASVSSDPRHFSVQLCVARFKDPRADVQWIRYVIQSGPAGVSAIHMRDYPAVLNVVEALRCTPTRFAGLRASTTSPRSREGRYRMAEKSYRE
jgi:hypothetical protein